MWSHDGLICTGETYKNVVKMTFAKGAALEDPSGLFNSSLDGNTRRAIDFHEGEKIDESGIEGSDSRGRDAERGTRRLIELPPQRDHRPAGCRRRAILSRLARSGAVRRHPELDVAAGGGRG